MELQHTLADIGNILSESIQCRIVIPIEREEFVELCGGGVDQLKSIVTSAEFGGLDFLIGLLFHKDEGQCSGLCGQHGLQEVGVQCSSFKCGDIVIMQVELHRQCAALGGQYELAIWAHGVLQVGGNELIFALIVVVGFCSFCTHDAIFIFIITLPIIPMIKTLVEGVIKGEGFGCGVMIFVVTLGRGELGHGGVAGVDVAKARWLAQSQPKTIWPKG